MAQLLRSSALGSWSKEPELIGSIAGMTASIFHSTHVNT
jgi:hypothetical protein